MPLAGLVATLKLVELVVTTAAMVVVTVAIEADVFHSSVITHATAMPGNYYYDLFVRASF